MQLQLPHLPITSTFAPIFLFHKIFYHFVTPLLLQLTSDPLHLPTTTPSSFSAKRTLPVLSQTFILLLSIVIYHSSTMARTKATTRKNPNPQTLSPSPFPSPSRSPSPPPRPTPPKISKKKTFSNYLSSSPGKAPYLSHLLHYQLLYLLYINATP